MAALEWGTGARLYEQGLDRGVLYFNEGAVPWNGLAAVEAESVAAESTSRYFDGRLVEVASKTSDYAGKIKAYTYPDQFAEYDGYSNRNVYERFGLSYRTQYGAGYKLHLIFDAMITSQGMSWTSIKERPEVTLFGWDISASAVNVTSARPTAHLVIDSNTIGPVLKNLEDILYGTDTTEPRMPTPDELLDIYEGWSVLKIKRMGNGIYKISGPERLLRIEAHGTFTVTSPTVTYVGERMYNIQSYFEE